LFYPENEKALQ
jgi:1-phosphatidylinositol-4-phosphate 5-kinase